MVQGHQRGAAGVLAGVRPSGAVGVAQASLVLPNGGLCDNFVHRGQHHTLGHRGRKGDPLYRARRLLISAHERLNNTADAKLRGPLTAGDPRGEVRLAWHAKETLRGLYDIDCAQLAGAYLAGLADNLTRTDS